MGGGRKRRLQQKTRTFSSQKFRNVKSFIQTKAPNSILLNKENLYNLDILEKNRCLMDDPSIWHAFILKKVPLMSMGSVMNIVIDFLSPEEIIPVHFKTIGEDCLFLSFSCAGAVYKLWRNNLEIPNVHTGSPIRCDIMINYSSVKKLSFECVKIDYREDLKKFMIKDNILNLENLEGKEMPQYWPLSQPKILQIVLELSKTLYPTSLSLKNNSIRNVLPFLLLWDTKLTRLDLRNNLISDISQLEVLKMLNLSELWLDGNPLCNELDELTYIKSLKNIFPNLLKLDGITLRNNIGMAFRRNFLCNSNGFDLVNQFLEFYFPLYDSYRNLLINIYDKNATFSLTSSHIPNQETSATTELSKYEVNSRNIISLANVHKYTLLFRGAPLIVKKLLELPECQHDPSSFTVDLLFHKNNTSVISITGVFQERLSPKKQHLLGFNRTFTLFRLNGVYTIINDLLHVYNALNVQVKRSFRIKKPVSTSLVALTDKDKVKALEAIQSITGLKKIWAERFFEESNNDLVKCLRTFMAEFEVDKIPSEAFC